MVLYANAGYYQYLHTKGANMENSKLNTKTGSSIVFNTNELCNLAHLYRREIYLKFDVCRQLSNIADTNNLNPWLSIITANNTNDTCIYDFISRGDELVIMQYTNAQKQNGLELGTMRQMNEVNNKLCTVEVHLNLFSDNSSSNFLEISFDGSRTLAISGKKFKLFDYAIREILFSNGMPNNPDANITNMYLSNIIVGTKPLRGKNCICLPLKVLNNEWTKKNNGIYQVSSFNKRIDLAIDEGELNHTFAYDSSTSIDGIFVGSTQAYDSGSQGELQFALNGVPFSNKQLGTSPNNGIMSDILSQDLKHRTDNIVFNNNNLWGIDAYAIRCLNRPTGKDATPAYYCMDNNLSTSLQGLFTNTTIELFFKSALCIDKFIMYASDGKFIRHGKLQWSDDGLNYHTCGEWNFLLNAGNVQEITNASETTKHCYWRLLDCDTEEYATKYNVNINALTFIEKPTSDNYPCPILTNNGQWEVDSFAVKGILNAAKDIDNNAYKAFDTNLSTYTSVFHVSGHLDLYFADGINIRQMQLLGNPNYDDCLIPTGGKLSYSDDGINYIIATSWNDCNGFNQTLINNFDNNVHKYWRLHDFTNNCRFANIYIAAKTSANKVAENDAYTQWYQPTMTANTENNWGKSAFAIKSNIITDVYKVMDCDDTSACTIPIGSEISFSFVNPLIVRYIILHFSDIDHTTLDGSFFYSDDDIVYTRNGTWNNAEQSDIIVNSSNILPHMYWKITFDKNKTPLDSLKGIDIMAFYPSSKWTINKLSSEIFSIISIQNEM